MQTFRPMNNLIKKLALFSISISSLTASASESYPIITDLNEAQARFENIKSRYGDGSVQQKWQYFAAAIGTFGVRPVDSLEEASNPDKYQEYVVREVYFEVGPDWYYECQKGEIRHSYYNPLVNKLPDSLNPASYKCFTIRKK